MDEPGLMLLEAFRESLLGSLAYVQKRIGIAEDVLTIDLVKAIVLAIVTRRTAAVIQLSNDLLWGVRALPNDRELQRRSLRRYL